MAYSKGRPIKTAFIPDLSTMDFTAVFEKNIWSNTKHWWFVPGSPHRSLPVYFFIHIPKEQSIALNKANVNNWRTDQCS